MNTESVNQSILAQALNQELHRIHAFVANRGRYWPSTYTRKANVDILQALGLLQPNENWAKESLHDS